jgi:DNA polymerase III delta prime subunit
MVGRPRLSRACKMRRQRRERIQLENLLARFVLFGQEIRKG